MTDQELMQQALVALEAMQSYAAAEKKGLRICDEAIEALRARLAQPEQEPVVKWDASAPLVVHPHPAFQATQPQPDLAKVGEVGVWGEQDKENNDDKS